MILSLQTEAELIQREDTTAGLSGFDELSSRSCLFSALRNQLPLLYGGDQEILLVRKYEASQ